MRAARSQRVVGSLLPRNTGDLLHEPVLSMAGSAEQSEVDGGFSYVKEAFVGRFGRTSPGPWTRADHRGDLDEMEYRWRMPYDFRADKMRDAVP